MPRDKSEFCVHYRMESKIISVCIWHDQSSPSPLLFSFHPVNTNHYQAVAFYTIACVHPSTLTLKFICAWMKRRITCAMFQTLGWQCMATACWGQCGLSAISPVKECYHLHIQSAVKECYHLHMQSAVKECYHLHIQSAVKECYHLHIQSAVKECYHLHIQSAAYKSIFGV